MAALLLMPEAESIASAHADNNDYTRVVDVKHKVEKAGDNVNVSLTLDLDRLDIQKQHALMLTPVLTSADGQNSRTLAPIVINGKARQKIYERALAINKEYNTGAAEVIARHNGKEQTVDYTTTLPYSRWMRDARLTLLEEVKGCAACELGNDERTLGTILPHIDVEMPVFTTDYIAPVPQKVKRSEVKCELYLNFYCDKSDIVPELGNNHQELGKIKDLVKRIKDEPAFTITGFRVDGYASPEGSFAHNMALSERRSRSLAAYVQKSEGWKQSMFHVTWGGEDWQGLTDAVKASSLATKEQILNIIEQEPNPDARDAKIRDIDRDKTYATLLKDFYPPLRHSCCTVDFTIRDFTLDEAKVLINSHPEQLSACEMYDVAMAYPENSEARRKALETAYANYPDDASVAINTAIERMRQDKWNEAQSILEKAKDTPEVCNMRGIVYTHQKETDKAKTNFTKASSGGLTQAADNLKRLNQYLQQVEENNY